MSVYCLSSDTCAELVKVPECISRDPDTYLIIKDRVFTFDIFFIFFLVALVASLLEVLI